MKELTEKIRALALSHGFIRAGFSRAEELTDEKQYLQSWLEEGKHSGMKWMENNFDKRTNPSLINDTVSVISLAYPYDTPHSHSKDNNIPKISRYAWGSRDYHKVLKKKLKALSAEIEALSPGIITRYYVDDGPVMDKVWAKRSGIGWMGKNTNIINADIGSYFFLAELFINVELEYNSPVDDLCLGCNACLDACPTGALYDEYKLDADLCISYHTIENRGEIPDKVDLHGWIFGCDICQDVCPYNYSRSFTDDVNFFPRSRVMNRTYDDLMKLSEEEFNKLFEGTPVRRTKYKGFIRNLSKALAEKERFEK
jgi:epoxyqueuosine reductase